MADFTLTVWRNGASLSAQIVCPAFVDREDDLIELNDALVWAMQRTAQLDVFEPDD